MRYWGKVTGVIIALFSGAGLWAVLFGLLLGHAFDRTRRRHHAGGGDTFSAQQRQTIVMMTTFEVMGYLSKAKGRVTAADIDVAGRIMQRMGLYNQTLLAAQNAFRAGKVAHYPLHSKMHLLRRACADRVDLIRLFLDVQIETAFANGMLHPQTRHLLYMISSELGVSRQQFVHYLQNHPWFHGNDQHTPPPVREKTADPINAACLVLGIKPHNDATTIKRAYRKLMSEHHPDKLIARGLSPFMMQRAKQKAQQIQHAYDVIKLAKGFK